MKRITINYLHMGEREALDYAKQAIDAMPEKKGIVLFVDETMAAFSDRSKYTSITIWNRKKLIEERENG